MGKIAFYYVIANFRKCVSCYVQNNGHAISWKHVSDLYKKDSGRCSDTPGLCLIPKLKYEHIHLTSFSKMRVDLAAQVRLDIVDCA